MNAPTVFCGLVFVGLLSLVASCKVGQWNECRAFGHSKFYCAMQVSQ